MGLFRKSSSNASVEHVGALLASIYSPESFVFDGESGWMGRKNSTAVEVKVWPVNETSSTVHVNAAVIKDVEITPALCYELLTEARFRVGRWDVELDEDGSGRGIVCLGVDLINWEGSLDQAELENTIDLIAESADEIDDELVSRFGGSTFFTE